MIARIWTAQTTTAQAPAYVEHMRNNVLPALQQLDGYSGATLLERGDADMVEVMVITWWSSIEAIRGFAGDDLEKAVVADEAAAVLTRFDEWVRHFELVIKDDPDRKNH